MREFKSDIMWAVSVITVYCAAIMLVGCDEQKFEADHPVEARVIEELVEGGEAAAEGVVETETHIPGAILDPVFKHKVFVPPSEASKP